MLRSDLVATFVLIADAGSLNAAAGRLGLSRSVVSERLTALEADLGAKLVTRSTRGLSLTQSGELFLRHARQLLVAMDAARDAVAETDGALTGRLRIAVPEALGVDWLTPMFAKFLEDHPHITMEISSSDRTVDIVQEGFDLAVRSARHADSDLLARRLTTGRRLIVCSPNYARRNGIPKSLAELREHACLVYRNRRVSQDWTFQAGNKTRSTRVSGRFESDSGTIERQAAIEGVGIVLLPTFMVSGALIDGRLIPIDVGLPPESDTIAAVYPKAHRGMPRLQALIDHLHKALGDPPPWDRDLADAGILTLD